MPKFGRAIAALIRFTASSGSPVSRSRIFHGLLADDMGLGKTLQALAFCGVAQVGFTDRW